MFLDGMFSFIKKSEKTTEPQIQSLFQYLHFEQYDSDALTQDLDDFIEYKGGICVTSNIYNIHKNSICVELIKTYERNVECM